jgi:DNA-binding transcriptional MocR family regulator
VAHDQNVSVASGEIFEVSGEEKNLPVPHSLRICFAWEEDEDTIVEGIRRLGVALESMMAES